MNVRKTLIIGLVLILTAGLFGCGATKNETSKESAVNKSMTEKAITFDNVKVYGRNDRDAQSVKANWINSGIEVRFKGEQLVLEINCPQYEAGTEPYVQIWTDGERTARIAMLAGKNEYKVADGLPYGEHCVKALMVTESFYTPLEFLSLRISSSENESELLPPEIKDTLKFDFYGDSITAGFGTIPGYPDGYRTKDQDSTLTYAYRTAEHFNGEGNYIAISGWGCYQGWGPDTNARIPRISRFSSMVSQQEWDFSARKADIVVVSLGTNDAWFWTENMPKQDFIDKYLDFLTSLREIYPDAQFYCIHGMMDETFRDVVREVTEQYGKLDPNGAVYVDMPNMSESPEYLGSGGHPSGAFGEYASKTLISAIEKNMKNR